jgi:hypothetical protein
MMTDFRGMAVYNVDEIRSALERYETAIGAVEIIIQEKVKQAELEWQPTWWQKIRGVKTLREEFQNKDNWWSYNRYLDMYDYIKFNEEQLLLLRYLEYSWASYSGWEGEYIEIKALFNGGKECYLNPSQAAFVNTFKKEV